MDIICHRRTRGTDWRAGKLQSSILGSAASDSRASPSSATRSPSHAPSDHLREVQRRLPPRRTRTARRHPPPSCSNGKVGATSLLWRSTWESTPSHSPVAAGTPNRLGSVVIDRERRRQRVPLVRPRIPESPGVEDPATDPTMRQGLAPMNRINGLRAAAALCRTGLSRAARKPRMRQHGEVLPAGGPPHSQDPPLKHCESVAEPRFQSRRRTKRNTVDNVRSCAGRFSRVWTKAASIHIGNNRPLTTPTGPTSPQWSVRQTMSAAIPTAPDRHPADPSLFALPQ